jgi:hypothetical protein
MAKRKAPKRSAIVTLSQEELLEHVEQIEHQTTERHVPKVADPTGGGYDIILSFWEEYAPPDKCDSRKLIKVQAMPFVLATQI